MSDLGSEYYAMLKEDVTDVSDLEIFRDFRFSLRSIAKLTAQVFIHVHRRNSNGKRLLIRTLKGTGSTKADAVLECRARFMEFVQESY